MTVYLAIGYTVQQGVLSQLPESFITADQYRQLDIPGKQQAWKDFLLGDGSQPVWQESYQTGVSSQELDDLVALQGTFASVNGRCTAFVMGQWLDTAVEWFGQEDIRKSLQSPQIEVASHGYDQTALKPTGISERDAIAPVLEEQASAYHKIQQASRANERHLGVRPEGLRAFLGNTRPLDTTADQDMIQAIAANGIKYLNSCFREEPRKVNVPGTTNSTPQWYSPPGLVEIPSVGPFDVHGSQPTRLLIHGLEGSWTMEERVALYTQQIEHALRHRGEKHDHVTVPFLFHAWEIQNSDQNLVAIREILNFATKQGVKIVSYGDINNIFRNGGFQNLSYTHDR